MKTLIISLCLLSLAACEAPQRTRTGILSNAGSSGSNNFTQPGSTTGNTTGGTTWSGTTTSGSTSGSNSGSNNLGAGFENCDISQKYYAHGVNWIGICQSTLDETQMAINPNTTSSQRTCIIPTYKSSNGSSTYLGQPQCFAPVANQVTTGNVFKTRSGFMNNPITGVMVMLESSVEAYYFCMNSYANFRSNTCPYGAQTNQACSQQASQYMNTVCSDFKTRHSYLDLCVKTGACSNN